MHENSREADPNWLYHFSQQETFEQEAFQRVSAQPAAGQFISPHSGIFQQKTTQQFSQETVAGQPISSGPDDLQPMTTYEAPSSLPERFTSSDHAQPMQSQSAKNPWHWYKRQNRDLQVGMISGIVILCFMVVGAIALMASSSIGPTGSIPTPNQLPTPTPTTPPTPTATPFPTPVPPTPTPIIVFVPPTPTPMPTPTPTLLPTAMPSVTPTATPRSINIPKPRIPIPLPTLPPGIHWQ